MSKDKFKKILPYIINSVVIVLIFCFILFLSKTSPFGSKLTIGKSDALYQYKPMLYNFIMRLKTNTLYQFTFNNGLGNSFFFNFAYYLTSPLNLIAIFFKTPDLMYLSVILIKIVLTVIFCTFYTKRRGCSNLVSFIVSISYVFSSWFIVYYYNIIWLDTFMILPLFQYGLEELITNNKTGVFIFSLAYAYATNFLISFSVLIYGLIFFIIKNFFYDRKNIKQKLKTLGYFLISIIFSLLMIAFYFQVLVMIKRKMGLGFSDASDSAYLLSTIDFIKSLFYGNNILTLDFSGNTFPNLAVNTFIFLNTIYYFINSKIKPREKAFTLIGIFLCIICLFSTKFDYVVNFFHNVVGLTYRYAFIFNFLQIILFIRNAQNFDNKDLKKMKPIIIILMLIVICLIKNMGIKNAILNLIFLFIYLLIIIFYRKEKFYQYILLFVISFQCLFVGYQTIPSNLNKNIESNIESFNSKSFKYRLNTIGDNDYLNKNLYTNQDVTYEFTSMTYNEVLDMVQYLGVRAGYNGIAGNIYNDLFSLLFNVKNDYYLEKIYAVNKDIKEVNFKSQMVKENTEDLVYKMTGIKNIYNEINLQSYKSDDNNNYYKTSEHYFLIKDASKTYPLLNNEFTSSKDIDTATIYTLNNKKLEEIYNYLSLNQINYTSYRDDKLVGQINVSDNQMIFTSIPYDDSWIIKIDNKKVEPIKLLDSLIGIEVEPGLHEISMEYHCDFSKSIKISLGTLITLIGIYIIKKIIKYRRTNKINKGV